MDKHSFPNGKRLVRDTLKPDDNLHYEKFSDGTVKCIEDEIPFDVPDNWEWVRIKTACVINPRNSIDDNTEVSFVPMANIKEGYANKFISDIRVWKKVKKGYTHFADNDIGIAKITPCFENKKSVVFSGLINGYGAGTTELHIVRTISSLVIPEYLLNFVKRDDFITGGVLTFSGDVGQQRVTKDYVANYLFTLPPLNEQQRILNAVHNANSLIESIEKSKDNLIRDIDKTKSKILDLAIRGKLVPQDPNDEPASVLLERIRAEKEELINQGKIKRNKKESVIFKGSDNSYYQGLPENWEICSIMAIAEVDLGKALDKNKNTGKFYPYLRSVNIKWNEIDLSDIKEMQFEKDELQRYSIIKGDLLICEGGDVGRCCIWSSDETIYYQNALHRVRFHGGCKPKYFLYFMMYLEHTGYLKRISNGVTIKHLTKTVLTTIPFMLPPIAEQKRIVDEIEKIFAILDNIANQVA